MTVHHTETAALAEFLANTSRQPAVITVTDPRDGTKVPILLKPDGPGWSALNADEVENMFRSHRLKPLRREGVAAFEDLDSFIRHCLRFQNANSAIFAQMRGNETGRLVSVLDYHPIGAGSALTDNRRHRGLFEFPLSREWQAWRDAEGKVMGQAEFAEFLEDRILDVMPPPEFLTTSDTAAETLTDADQELRRVVTTLGGRVADVQRLMDLARGLKINQRHTVKNAVNLDNGEGEIRFQVEHTDTTGAPMRVPNMFLVAVPVLKGGPLYRLPVRLRYRAKEGAVLWTVSRITADRIFDHAAADTVERVRTDTGLPVFMGRDEE